MHLDEDAFWQFGLRLALEEPTGARQRDSILLRVRFKKLETRYIVSLFGARGFEVAAPTPEALQPIYESILNAVQRHYDYGLRLFLENGGRGLRIPINTRRLLEMAHGSSARTVAVQPAAPAAAPQPPPAPAARPARLRPWPRRRSAEEALLVAGVLDRPAPRRSPERPQAIEHHRELVRRRGRR